MTSTQTLLTEESLALMNQAQKRVVLKQWQMHQHENHKVNYDVSGEGDLLAGFAINKGVWYPFLASGRFHARYLFYNNRLFKGKTAIDIGSGTGIMGIVMAKYGARRVIMSDISPLAVENTRENVKIFGLEDKVEVVQGDLFENVPEKADLIMWNIPFFPGNPPAEDTISASMIMPPELFERFLVEAKAHLKEEGVVVVPSYSLGGDLTNPRIVGTRLGYNVKTTWEYDNQVNGIQRGILRMDELTLRR